MWNRIRCIDWQLVVSFLTLVVLTATLVEVGKYACEARRQTRISAKNLEITNRPIVAVAGYSPRESDLAHPGKSFAYVNILNFGHLPAKVRVRKAAIFANDPLPAGPDPSHAPQEDLIVPPGNVGNRIDYANAAPVGQSGRYYLAGLIEYDTAVAHYHTRFCLEFTWPDTLPNKEARLCADSSVNNIN